MSSKWGSRTPLRPAPLAQRISSTAWSTSSKLTIARAAKRSGAMDTKSASQRLWALLPSTVCSSRLALLRKRPGDVRADFERKPGLGKEDLSCETARLCSAIRAFESDSPRSRLVSTTCFCHALGDVGVAALRQEGGVGRAHENARRRRRRIRRTPHAGAQADTGR